MRCPSCLTVITEPVEACQTCGFTLARLDIVFGTIPRFPALVNDHSAVFDEQQQHRLEQFLSRLKRDFSDLHVSVVTMELNARFNPREYLFWLVNRGRFSPIEHKFERSLLVVLFIDTLGRTVLLTTGYGLQTALPEEKLQAAIDMALATLKKGEIYRGSLEILMAVRRNLRSFCSSQRTEKNPVFPASSPAPELQNVL